MEANRPIFDAARELSPAEEETVEAEAEATPSERSCCFRCCWRAFLRKLALPGILFPKEGETTLLATDFEGGLELSAITSQEVSCVDTNLLLPR